MNAESAWCCFLNFFCYEITLIRRMQLKPISQLFFFEVYHLPYSMLNLAKKNGVQSITIT